MVLFFLVYLTFLSPQEQAGSGYASVHADPDREAFLMQIRADPDPKHWRVKARNKSEEMFILFFLSLIPIGGDGLQ